MKHHSVVQGKRGKVRKRYLQAPTLLSCTKKVGGEQRLGGHIFLSQLLLQLFNVFGTTVITALHDPLPRETDQRVMFLHKFFVLS